MPVATQKRFVKTSVPRSNRPHISVVVPVYNEQGAVQALHRDILAALTPLKVDFEVVFVDDGSSDATFEALSHLSPLTIVRFRKNFGQTAAMEAGIRQSKGQLIITMDGDGQNPPSEIPKLLKRMKEGSFDVVSGWRKDRKDTPMKRFVSRGANKLRHILLDDTIHDSGCSLKVYKAECFEDLHLMGEMHRFIPQLLAWKGFRIGEVEVKHLPRKTGVTKYDWKRTVKGFIDMASLIFWRRYSDRPLHLFGGIGLLMMAIGSVAFLFLLYRKFIEGIALSDSSLPLLAATAVVLGVQAFVGGVLADILIKNYYDSRPVYSILDVTKRDARNENVT